MNSKSLGILIIAALVVAAAGGYWLGTTKSTPDGDTGISTSGPRQPLFYRNPMNPEVTSPVPAKDAMGMDYIPVYAADAEGAGRAGTVQIDPVTVQNIGVRTAEAERRSIGRTIQTVGRVDYDEQRLVQLHPKTEGWVEKLYVDTTGSPVKKDAMLLSLYSPQLVSTQQEYVLALRNLETLHASPFEDVRRGAKELVETALERLRLLDVPDHQITDLTNTLEVKKQLHIHSPANGIVINIGAREGQYVTPPTELYAIADLSKVWVYVDIYEDELPWIRVGDQATIKVRAVPGQTFRGRLSYIYPYAESKTRTIKVRMEFDNADLLLKPNMFADVTIDASAIPDVIVVPSEAIIRSGAREQVFIRRAPGKFEPREVVLGVSSQGWTQIREGVAPGEEVVVSAQFLIDSESKLREASAKMQEVNHD
jgi:Cu(I)/Ag(I) efflux system membrane fusion protein